MKQLQFLQRLLLHGDDQNPRLAPGLAESGDSIKLSVWLLAV